jgi:hypothetical protein
VDLPSEDNLRWLVAQYASLLAEHGEGIGSPRLVQPTGADFPDAFELSGPGIARFLQRMIDYAPVSSDLDLQLRFLAEEGEGGSCGTGGCGTGACGDGKASAAQKLRDRVIDADEAYILEVPERDVMPPVRLATTLARSVGSLVLFEAGVEVDDADLGAVSEVAATACGFGVLLLAGSHMVGKSCGGFSIARHTYLATEELAVLLALFTRLHGLKPREARAYLEPTQKEAFDEALEWVDSQSTLLVDLSARPELLADGVFKIESSKGLLGRLFSGKKPARDPVEIAPVSPRRAPRSAEDQRRLDEARAMVDAALGKTT